MRAVSQPPTATHAGARGSDRARPAEDFPMTKIFSKYLSTPYQPYIRPATPPDGPLAPNSRIEREKRGKVPGLWSGKDWIGLPGFLQDKSASSSSLAGWDTWPTESVALRTGVKFNG